MKQITSYQKKVPVADDVVISADNIMTIGKVITFSSLKCVQGCTGLDLTRYYKGLIKNIHHPTDIEDTLSDGFEIYQEALCYLCNFMGKKVGDTYAMDRKGKVVTIFRACLRYTEKFIMKYIRLSSDTVELETGKDKPCHKIDITEEEHDKADRIKSQLDLTPKQSAVLECYINNMRLTDIAIELKMLPSSVCNLRKKIQQKYTKKFAAFY